MRNSHLRPFGIPVLPEETESLISVISRAAERNVFTKLSTFLQYAGIGTLRPAYVSFTKLGHATSLAQRLGLPENEIRLRMHDPIETHEHRTWVNWYGTIMPRRLIDADIYRFSPTSLRLSPFHRSSWMLKPLQFCSESMEMLATRCVKCRREQVWQFSSTLDVCEKCKHPLTQVASTFLPENFHQDALAVATLADTRSAVRDRSVKSLPAPFNSWEAGEVFAAVVELGAALNDPNLYLRRKIKGGDFSEFQPSHLIAGYRLVRSWPRSLEDMMADRIRTEKTHMAYKLRSPFQSYFNGCAQSKLRDLIRSAVPEALRRTDIAIKGPRDQWNQWMNDKGMIAQNQARLRFKIDRHILRRLNLCGRCVIRDEHWRGQRPYRLEMLDAAIKSLRGAVTKRQCASVLGVPIYCVESLGERGLLEVVSNGDAQLLADEPIYEKASLRNLEKRLKPQAIESGSAGVTIASLLRRRFHPEDWCDALEAVLDGRLKTALQPGEMRAAVARLVVDRDEGHHFVDRLVRRVNPKDIFVTQETAGLLLVLNPLVIAGIVNSGLLRVTGQTKKVNIALSDLAQFDAQYFVCTEALQTFGLDSRVLGQQMRASGYVPVASVWRRSVWLRRDVKRVVRANVANGQLTMLAA